ncbi:uncharacterized protein LOC130721376 [Lotus japonicus]|uniref:uncharacterized protein LOC130721376 n=1 Tax=Lotus japonicus TaxID=34305 RepID=UPI00258C5803|nr:uncharacterized protein LOC130721376 [Lotus japonicus]
MLHMELRSTFTTCFFLFLILALPHFLRGESEALLHSEIYEIDYRGPETHSSVPPPHHSGGHPHSTSQKALISGNHEENKVKEIRG